MLPNWYNEYKILIEESINSYLEEYFDTEKNKGLDIIKEATLYSVQWWKRIRSILALEFYQIFSWVEFKDIKENDNIIKFCIALELLHAYSLIHDDLPSIDNDEYRRWNLTTWKKYWETNAILVWDLLNSLSFEILSEIWELNLIKFFWEAVWLKWMLWWQVLDIYYEKNNNKLDLDKLIEVHNKKTWKLIKVSILWWILLWNLNKENNSNKKEIEKYLEFWEKIWLAFQIKDDLLDVEWTLEETGKSVWWENKWFVYFIWEEKTRKYLNDLVNECLDIIKNLNSNKLEFIIK